MALALAVDVAKHRIEGTNTIRVRANAEGAASLTLNAIDFESLDLETDHATLVVGDETSTLTWATPFGHGEEREVVLRYAVEAPITGLIGNPFLAEDPERAVFLATDSETERARYWMPCVDHPAVRTTFRYELRAASELVIIAGGSLTGEEDHGDGTKTAVWELSQRSPSYLACFAVGPFITWSPEDESPVPCPTYALAPRTEADLERSFAPTAAMMRWLTDRLQTPFPYPKYAQFVAPGVGGAMENISLTSWDDLHLLDASLAPELQRLFDQINVHEMAHSYFGDHVVCRDFAHAWLKESWATYIEQCWLAHEHGADEALLEYIYASESYFDEADLYVRPLVVREVHSSFELYDNHLYPGGACRLHNLRKQLGDHTFWTATRNYLHRYGGEVVETDEFRRVFEDASGRSLGPWFDQWVFGKGFPDLEVTLAAAGDTSTLTIKQTQIDEKNGVKAFNFDLDVAWTVNGESGAQTLQVRGAETHATLPFGATPSAIRIDPEQKVLQRLSFNPGTGVLVEQLRSDDVMGRVLAGRELCKTGKPKAIAAVVDAWAQESFWGVRVEWTKAIASAPHARAADALAGIVATETDPLAMADTFAAAGAVRTEAIKEALVVRLDEDLPPRARGAAYNALGKMRDDAPIQRLLDAAKVETHPRAAQGLYGGLAATWRMKGRKTLLSLVKPGGAPPEARRFAVAALGAAATGLEAGNERQRVVEAMVDLLRDPNNAVALQAARALCKLAPNSEGGSVEAFARTLANQDGEGLLYVLHFAREGSRSAPAERDAEWSKLQSRVAELERGAAKSTIE
jgi:aminopeptidase N